MTAKTQLIWTVALAGGLLLGLIAVAGAQSGGTISQVPIATLQATSPAQVWFTHDRWGGRGWGGRGWEGRGWGRRGWDRDDWRWRWHDRDDDDDNFYYYRPYYWHPEPDGDESFFWYRGPNYGFGFGF